MVDGWVIEYTGSSQYVDLTGVRGVAMHTFEYCEDTTTIYIDKTTQQIIDMNYAEWFEMEGYERTVTIICTDGQLTVNILPGPIM